jgi:hypothetical protein
MKKITSFVFGLFSGVIFSVVLSVVLGIILMKTGVLSVK